MEVKLSPLQQINCECGSIVWINYFSIDVDMNIHVKGRCLGEFDKIKRAFSGGCGHPVSGVISRDIINSLWLGAGGNHESN